MNITLTRISQAVTGTFGSMKIDGQDEQLCVTCEPTWRENDHGISCIPAGRYTVDWKETPRFPNGVFQLLDVPNRSGIDIHAGNTYKDTEGCILVGKGYGTLNGVPSIFGSRDTLAKIEEVLPSTFTLTILDRLGR